MMVMMMDSHRGKLNHRHMDANTYALKVPRVAADISNPSGAMDTVAAIAKMVTMDMEDRMLTRVAGEKNALPRIAVKITTASTRTITAAQFRSR